MISKYQEFKDSLQLQEPPTSWSVHLRSLWFDAKNNWHASHDLVDQLSDSMSKQIHAYLHRKEGDEWNAGYWYRQAGKPFCKLTLDEEFQLLLKEILRN